MVPKTSPEGDAANGVRTGSSRGSWCSDLADSKRQISYSHGFHATQRTVSQGTECSLKSRRTLEATSSSGLRKRAVQECGHFRTYHGLYFGHNERSGAALFLTTEGLMRGTRVVRQLEALRWEPEFLNQCGMAQPAVARADLQQESSRMSQWQHHHKKCERGTARNVLSRTTDGEIRRETMSAVDESNTEREMDPRQEIDRLRREKKFPQGAELVPGVGENVDLEDAEVPPTSPQTPASETQAPRHPRKRIAVFSEDESVEVKDRKGTGLKRAGEDFARR